MELWKVFSRVEGKLRFRRLVIGSEAISKGFREMRKGVGFLSIYFNLEI